MRFEGLILSLLITVAFSLTGCGHAGVGVTAEEANKSIHQDFNIPDDARQVTYLTNPRATSVSVWLSEESFKRWANSKGWSLAPIAKHNPSSMIVLDGSETGATVTVSEGWRFMEEGGVGYGGTFDADREVATVVFGAN
jgi:hypothetical protein